MLCSPELQACDLDLCVYADGSLRSDPLLDQGYMYQGGSLNATFEEDLDTFGRTLQCNKVCCSLQLLLPPPAASCSPRHAGKLSVLARGGARNACMLLLACDGSLHWLLLSNDPSLVMDQTSFGLNGLDSRK